MKKSELKTLIKECIVEEGLFSKKPKPVEKEDTKKKDVLAELKVGNDIEVIVRDVSNDKEKTFKIVGIPTRRQPKTIDGTIIFKKKHNKDAKLDGTDAFLYGIYSFEGANKQIAVYKPLLQTL
jgi:hypothetical protein